MCKNCGVQDISLFDKITKRGLISYRCSKCRRDSVNKSSRKYRARYNEEQRIRRRSNPEIHRKKYKIWYNMNADKRCEYMKKLRQEVKEKVLNHYSQEGLHCACPGGCQETNIKFLCLDHINGGGKQHRIKIKARGSAFYTWIIKNNFPDGYRVLCHNCNHALGAHGKCPHQV
jgi:hypothetical protein